MKDMMKKKCGTWLKAAAVSSLLASPVWADDSDIYLLTGNAYNDGVLRVMLTLDARASAGSVLCTNGATGTECDDLWGGRGEDSLLIGHVDMFNADGQLLTDGYADVYQPAASASVAWDPNDYPYTGSESVADQYWPGSKVQLFDAIRTVVRASLEKVAGIARANADKIGGVEVGLMVSHGASCRDPGPKEAGNNCSGGAYVLQGFTDILDEQGLGLQAIYQKIGAMRYNDTDWPGKSNNFSGHAYNMRDIYLEYFRYIKGGEAHSAFLGYEDYNSDVSTGNLHQKKVKNDVLIPMPYDPNAPGRPLLSPDLDRPGLDYLTLARRPVWAPNPGTGADDRIESGTYNSPLTATEECSSLFMVHSMFGDTNPSGPSTNTALENTGLNIDFKGGGQNKNDQQVVSEFYKTDLASVKFPPEIAGEQNLTSYFLTKSGHSTANSDENLLAKAGGSGQAYRLDDPQAMLDTWDFIWGEILSVSTTFVAASVPVNVFDRANSVDNIYFAIFEAEKEVRWNGNVKKLKLVTVNDPDSDSYDPNSPSFDMISQNSNPPSSAISQSDGRINANALTFWTDPAGADVVAVDPDPLSFEVSGKDGRSVTRGGSGQQITGYLTDSVGEHNGATGARQVFTQDPALATTNKLLALDARSDAASVSAMLALSGYLDPGLNLIPADERTLIGWIRGLEDVVSGASRSWLMSDPMHSRPLVINYGISGGNYTEENPDIRLFFGTNDGVMHVLRNTEDDGSESGEEVFAFVPLELLEMQSTLRNNGQQSIEPHPYGLDGEAVSYVVDADGDGSIVSGAGSNDSVWIYIGMRRGGKALYAFDMTNPDAPAFKWKITNDMADYRQLGMTFSRPFATEIDLDGNGIETPVLIFAGGYNGGWKDDGTSDRIGKDIVGNRTADDVGNAIYVVDADTGSLIWKAVGPGADDALSDTAASLFRHDEMQHSIPSNISVTDTDGNGMVDRGYVGDTGGNVWRIELVEAATDVDDNVTGGPKDWYVTRLASLATTPSPDPAIGDIRFFHAPDFAQTKDADGDYDAVIIASGNRADPLDPVTENYLYMIKDREVYTKSGLVDRDIPPSDLTDITDLCISGLETDCLAADLGKGWKLKLETAGEKGLSKPVTANGLIFLTAYSPFGGAENECGPSEGSGNGYVVSLKNGSAAFNLFEPSDQDLLADADKVDRFTDIGPGIPGDIIVLDSDRLLVPGKGMDADPFGDGGGGGGGGGGSCEGQFCLPGGESLWRIYWREAGVDRP
jgi:type IV pilus assembly protein PilY1